MSLHSALFFSIILHSLVFVQPCCISVEDYFEERLNESTILEIQRELTDTEVCVTVTGNYVGWVIESEIDLGDNEEFFTVIGNDTRKLWIENLHSINFETHNETCVLSICGQSLSYNKGIATCRMMGDISELNLPSEVELK